MITKYLLTVFAFIVLGTATLSVVAQDSNQETTTVTKCGKCPKKDASCDCK